MSRPHSATLPAETIELLQVLGFLKLQNGNPQDAMALLEACDCAGGCQGRSLILLALVQLRAGAAAKALATLDRADPAALAQPSYRIVRAQALTATGRHEEARQAMKAYAALRAGSAA